MVALAIAVQGLVSAQALNLHAKLLLQMSLDWWDFGTSVADYFGHCMAFAGLCKGVTYYGVRRQQRRKHKLAF